MKKSILSILLCITLCLSMAIPGMAAETADAETTDITMQTYSSENDNPETLAIRRGNTFYFQENLTDTTVPDSYSYGKESDEILVGDWDGDGLDTFCMRRGNTYYFSNDLTSETAETEISFGKATDEVLAGDWDGDGIDTLCVRRGNTYYFLNDISESGAMTESFHAKFGNSTDVAYAGDWDGDGIDTLAVCRNRRAYYITNDESMEVSYIIYYGSSTDDGVLIGDWNSDGRDTFCRRVGNTYYFQEYLSDTASRPFETVKLGKSSDSVYAGRWMQSNEVGNTVIATGEAAIMVQMLGGKGALAATDQETYNAMSAYFPSAELEEIQILWDSNAAGGINTSKLSSFLSETTQTVVYLYDYSDVNTSDISALSASGVSNAALTFTTYNNMLSAADTVVSNLGTDTASQMRDSYKTFCSEIAEAVGEYDSAKYTLYVSGWDSDEQLTMSSVTGAYTWSSQYGVGIAAKLSRSPANSLWKLAGIYNNYSVSTSTSRGTRPAVSSYSYAYISQYSFVGNVSLRTGNYMIESNGNVLLYNLGSDSYPALIVASQDVYNALMNDKSQSPESGSMMGLVTTTNGSGSRSLVVNGTATDIVAVISDDYDVYVNPDGLGDWVGGSAESILESVWAAWRIQAIFTEDQVESAIREFYSTFYRCDLTDKQVVTILEGN